MNYGSASYESVQKVFDDLEAMGLIRKTGEFRPDHFGDMQPVYEAIPEAELTEEARINRAVDACRSRALIGVPLCKNKKEMN